MPTDVKYPPVTVDVVIDSLGHKGDGFGRSESGDRIGPVPLVVPGDHVRLKRQKKEGWVVDQILEPSPQRQVPPCPYFGRCGGCQLQHLSLEAYQAFKIQQLEKSLTFHGLTAYQLAPMMTTKSSQRRRVVLKAHVTQKQESRLGYYQRQSHSLVDVSSCLLLEEPLESLLSPLRLLLPRILSAGQSAEVAMTQTAVGVDLLLIGIESNRLSLEQREALTDFARIQDLARLSLQGKEKAEPIVTFREPFVLLDEVPVPLEPQGFLQASKAMDQTLAHMVANAPWHSVQRVADLFCGRGTLTMPLARRFVVDGFESDPCALANLKSAVLRSHRPITVFQRNLFEDPLTVDDLNGYDAVVLDPPRVGALNQVKLLAQSKVAHILMVSCNVDTFARDAALLKTAGYQMGDIYPMDQFLWSTHLEVAAFFQKPSD